MHKTHACNLVLFVALPVSNARSFLFSNLHIPIISLALSPDLFLSFFISLSLSLFFYFYIYLSFYISLYLYVFLFLHIYIFSLCLFLSFSFTISLSFCFFLYVFYSFFLSLPLLLSKIHLSFSDMHSAFFFIFSNTISHVIAIFSSSKSIFLINGLIRNISFFHKTYGQSKLKYRFSYG